MGGRLRRMGWLFRIRPVGVRGDYLGILCLAYLALGIVAPGVDARVFLAGHAVGPSCVHHVSAVGGQFVAFDVQADVAETLCFLLARANLKIGPMNTLPIAAMLVMCARGVSAFVGAALIIIPRIPKFISKSY